MTVTAANATDFATAANNIRAYALDQFNTAFTKVVSFPAPRDPPGTTVEDKEAAKTAAAALAKLQGQMATAFSQIGDAEHQKEQAAGYTSVVALMGTTATAAASICGRIAELMGATGGGAVAPEAVAEIDALGRALTALAALSPASLWQVAPAASTSGG
jgi:hypothetical protein